MPTKGSSGPLLRCSAARAGFPKEHGSKIASTNCLERLNKEIKRRANVVGIFPNNAAVIRLVGAILLEQNDDWQVSRGYLSKESLAQIYATSKDNAVTYQEAA